jgi:chromate transporter
VFGSILAWIGFTLPSAAAMVAFAYGVNEIGNVAESAWLHGLKLAAVAIVAFAVWGMARSLAPDRERATIALAAAVLALSFQTAFAQVLIILLAGVIGWRLFGSLTAPAEMQVPIAVGRNVAIAVLILFLGLLIALPVAAALVDSQALNLADSFYRTGSLVFGGGHVVLPLLEREVVPSGWVTTDDFLAGYGAAQAVPGPLFTFSAYLGAVSNSQPNGLLGASIAMTAIFLPSFLLVICGLQAWSLVRRNPSFLAGLRGINAAVVGLLLAALYDPVFTTGVKSADDFGLAIAAFGLLAFWKTPAWLVVVLVTAASILLDLA